MAVSIGKLAVTLTARTSKFRKRLAGATKPVAAIASRIGGLAKTAAKFGLVMAAAAAAGIAFFTKKAFESIDATAKLARQLGASIDGLRGLERAAEITGASKESLTKGLGFLSKALGEAKTGIGEGKQALEELGLSAEDLIGLPTEQAVGKIADRMNTLGTQAEKAFVASKLFGRGGLALVNTLALGSKGLEEMSAGAKILQGTLTAFDAAKVEEANDSIRDMRSTWTGLFERIAVATAPFVKKAADNVARIMIWLRQQVTRLLPQIMNWLKGAAVGLSTFISGIWDEVRQIPNFFRWSILQVVRIWKTGIIKLKTEFATFKGIISTGWEGIGTLAADMWDNIKIAFFKSISAIGNRIVKIARWLADKLPGENKWIQNMIEGYEQGLGIVDKKAEKIERGANERWRQFWGRNEQARAGMTKDLDKLNQELATLKKFLAVKEAGLLTGRGAGKGWGVAIQNIIDEIKKIELPEVTEAFQDGGAMAGENISKAIKAVTTPAAIEKGSIEAYSATVRSTYRTLADSGKRTVSELRESNRLQREANRKLDGIGTKTVTVGIP